MEARKENKVYTITEAQKARYLKEGFDIYDEHGNVLEYTPLKTIKYNDHIKKMNELSSKKDEEIEKLKKLLESENQYSESIQELYPESIQELLKAYAEKKSINIGSSTSPNGILTKILEFENS